MREREGIPHSLLSTGSAGGQLGAGGVSVAGGGGSGESSSGDAREPGVPLPQGMCRPDDWDPWLCGAEGPGTLGRSW